MKAGWIAALAVTGMLAGATTAIAQVPYEDDDAQVRPMAGPGGAKARGGMRAMRTLKAADANGDNTVTRAEYASLQSEMFVYLDRDGDGALSIADRSPIAQRLHADRSLEGDVRGRRQGRRGGGMQRLDTDQDGTISRDEYMNRETPLFDRLDADGNDAITPDELDAAAARREERRYWWRDSQ